jgi:hypothetical protein
MTRYIKWNIDTDTAFRAAYFEVVGERVQVNPREDGNGRLMGSEILAPEHIETLAVQFPAVEFYETWPDGWTDDLKQQVIAMLAAEGVFLDP